MLCLNFYKICVFGVKVKREGPEIFCIVMKIVNLIIYLWADVSFGEEWAPKLPVINNVYLSSRTYILEEEFAPSSWNVHRIGPGLSSGDSLSCCSSPV